MDPSRLSEYYLIACERVHSVIDDLYETLHDKNGEPIQAVADVVDSVVSARKLIAEELDLIRSIISEYAEHNP
jgi:Mg2+ and Co2+ transporter CorA